MGKARKAERQKKAGNMAEREQENNSKQGILDSI